MAVSAFRSRTSRGGNGGHSSSSSAIPSSDSGSKVPHRRSRSVSAVARNYDGTDEFSNKRDNPLFCSSSSLSHPDQLEIEARARRGRSVSRVRDAPSRRRSSSSSCYRNSDSEPRTQAEDKTIRAVSEQTKACPRDRPSGNPDIYEAVRSEVRRAISEIQLDLENVIFGKDSTVIADANVAHIPLEISRGCLSTFNESQERGRKLQAELTVEAQQCEPMSTNRNPHPRRKTSIERRKMSQRLTEEAMNYFDECVSISTFDSSDFSSTEDSQHNLPASVAAVGGGRFLPLISSSISAHRVGTHCNNFEEFDGQEEMATSLSSANLTISSKRKSLVKDSGNVSDTSTEESMSSLFSFDHEPTSAVTGIQNEVRTCIKMFKKSTMKDSRDVKVVRCRHYDADDSVRWLHSERLMFDVVLAKKKIESGSLLICSPRCMF